MDGHALGSVNVAAWQQNAVERAYVLGEDYWERLEEAERNLVAALKGIDACEVTSEQSADLIMAWARVVEVRT